MAPTLYSKDASPPCRAVLLTSKALGVDLNTIKCDPIAGHHLTSEFLKLNPGHTIPTLVDGDLVIPNSHAISIYLVDKYGKDHSLYPKEAAERAIINHRLFFDEGTAFASLVAGVMLVLFENKPLDESTKKKMIESYKTTETLLQNKKWIAGDNLSIADFHLVTTITSALVMVPIKEKEYPNIFSWIAKCETLPYYEINRKGLRDFEAQM